MSNFEEGIGKYFKDTELAKIRGVRVGIAGAGGLGSNCAVNLVRCGFLDFVVVDYDVVEGSNLNRQFFFDDQVGKAKVEALKDNLLRINPDVRVEAINLKIGKDTIKDLFESCDIVVEAFDEVAFKKLIVETYMSSEKCLVAASGIGGWGNSDNIKIRKVRDTFYIVGDSVSEVGENCPPVSPSVTITAAKQADVVLSYVLRKRSGDKNV